MSFSNNNNEEDWSRERRDNNKLKKNRLRLAKKMEVQIEK